MNYLRKISLFLVLLTLTTWLTPTEKAKAEQGLTTVAVLDFKSSGGADPTYVEAFFQRFTMELVSANKFRIIDRQSMKLILTEQRFQMTGCTESECAVEIGRILSVQKVIVGNVVRSGNTYYVVVQMINVQTALIEQTFDVRCECSQDLGAFLDSALILAHKLVGTTVTIQGPPAPPQKKFDPELQRAKRIRTYGRVMTAGGAVIGTAGVIMMLSYHCDYKTSSTSGSTNDKSCSGMNILTSIPITVAGGAILAGGIPTWIYGSNKVRKIEQKKGRITSYNIMPIIREDEYGLSFALRY